MRVLLVHPEFPITYWGFQYSLPVLRRGATLPPLGLISLAALLPRDWSLRLVDLNVRPLRDEDVLAADVVFTGGMLIQAPSILAVIEACHRLGRRVVVGGPGCTTSPEKFATADVIFRGEAEGRIESLVEALRAPSTAPRVLDPPSDAKPDLANVPPPRFDLLELSAYKAMSVQYSRGCPFSCEFCDIIEIYGRLPRVKTPEQVLAEFDALYALGHRGTLFVVDDNFIGNRKSVRKLLPRVIEWQRERGYPFALFTEASVNLAGDADLVRNMVAAGFTTVFLGIETPSSDSLTAAKKKQNVGVDLVEAVDRITRAGMEVMAGFIVGFDTDDESIFEAQRRFIDSVPVPLAMIGILAALPETGLWRRLEAENRLRSSTDGDAFARPNFEPRMDERALLRGYAGLLEAINSTDAYFARAAMLIDRVGAGPRVPVTWDELVIAARAVVKLGVLGRRRSEFWGLVARALRRPHTMRLAFTHAIQAEHAIRYTQEHVLPRLREALAAASRDAECGREGTDAARSAAPKAPRPRRALPLLRASEPQPHTGAPTRDALGDRTP